MRHSPVALKLFARQFHALPSAPGYPASLVCAATRTAYHSAELCGVVVSRGRRGDALVPFALDDGSGAVDCALWLRGAPAPPPGFALGALVSVRGRVRLYQSQRALSVRFIRVEEDPNAEAVWAAEVVHLWRAVLDPSRGSCAAPDVGALLEAAASELAPAVCACARSGPCVRASGLGSLDMARAAFVEFCQRHHASASAEDTSLRDACLAAAVAELAKRDKVVVVGGSIECVPDEGLGGTEAARNAVMTAVQATGTASLSDIAALALRDPGLLVLGPPVSITDNEM
eukprot:m51a1_g8098 hypothetical protein (287) ;mRNA; f:76168-77271